MSFPIRTKSRSLNDWFATLPERFQRERSPKKSAFWGIVILIGLVLTPIVFANPDAVVELFGGRRRGGAAIIGAFVFPPLLIVAGGVFMFLWAHRYRLRGSGVISRSELFIVNGNINLAPTLSVLARGNQDPSALAAAITSLESLRVDARRETGNQIVVIASSPTDQVTFIGVLRMDPQKRGVLWIDQPPIEVSGDRYFDASELRLQAMAAKPTP